MRDITPQLLAEALQKMGYRAQVHEDSIESSTNGLKFLIYIQPTGWLNFSVAMVNPTDFSVKEANGFNAKYRFGKLYLDDRNDCFLTFDIFVRADPIGCFSEGLSLWEDLVGVFLNELAIKGNLLGQR